MHKQVFTSTSIQSFENGMTTSSVSKVFLKFITQHSSFHFTTSQVNEQQKVQKPHVLTFLTWRRTKATCWGCAIMYWKQKPLEAI